MKGNGDWTRHPARSIVYCLKQPRHFMKSILLRLTLIAVFATGGLTACTKKPESTELQGDKKNKYKKDGTNKKEKKKEKKEKKALKDPIAPTTPAPHAP